MFKHLAKQGANFIVQAKKECVFMKLEITGNECSGRKIFMYGNDITAQCESVEISVNPLEPVHIK